MPSKSEIIKQSEAAYSQWKDLWRKHSIHHGERYKMKPFKDLFMVGVGRACVVVANGASLEDDMETIKKYQDQVDILCCDKTLGHLLQNGIKPTYCMICDAQVNYDKYLKPWEDLVTETTALINVCANTEWADNGKWKDRYFFANEDAKNYEKEFMELSGCKNVIPAGTNVSNAMVIMLTQSDNNGPKNFFGYDKILLTGFDYCWKRDKYYAYDHQANGKNNYMRHISGLNLRGEMVFTSTNLRFSQRWLEKYCRVFGTNFIVNCSKNTILNLAYRGDLEEQIKYNYKPEDSREIRSLNDERNSLLGRTKKIESRLRHLALDHRRFVQATV